MPDDVNPTTPEADDAAPEEQPDQSARPTKTYTKAEVDAMVNKAKTGVRREYGDVIELRRKAEEYDRLQEESKSEQDKLRERADRAVRERDQALTRAKSTMIRSAIISAASRLGSVDPEAVAALIPFDEIIIEGDEVVGVEEAVRDLLHKKPYLRPGSARAGVDIRGGGSEPTVITRSQIREWMRNGQLTPERQKQIEEAQKAGRLIRDR